MITLFPLLISSCILPTSLPTYLCLLFLIVINKINETIPKKHTQTQRGGGEERKELETKVCVCARAHTHANTQAKKHEPKVSFLIFC